MSFSNVRMMLAMFLAAGACVVAVGCEDKKSGGGSGNDDCEDNSDCDDDEVCSDDGECVKVGGVGGGGVGGGPSGPGSGGAPTGPGPSSNSSSSAGPGPSSSSSSSAQMSSSSSGPPPGCENEATFDLCAECFVNMNPIGYEAYVTELFGACGCTAGATCQPQCDTNGVDDVCPSPGVVDINVASQACIDCMSLLDGTETCITDFQTGCQNNADCLQFISDLSLCPQ